MSYYELHQHSLTDVRLVSMEGLKRSVVAYQTLRLIAEENQKLEFLDTVIPSKLLPLIIQFVIPPAILIIILTY